jgi:AbrB family looped-hinge helix DNA binding protein
MEVTLSSKGQLVIPAPFRRRLRLRARSKVQIEEHEGGLLIRPIAKAASAIPPIDYLPPGALKLSRRDRALDRLAGPDIGPDDLEK